MYCFPNNCNPLKKNEVFDKSLNLHLQAKRAQDCLKWGVINLVALVFLLIDISYKCPYAFSKWYYFECAIIGILSINLVVYALKYLFYMYIISDPVKGSAEQKKLLKFDDADNSFVIQPSPPTTTQPVNAASDPGNVTILSWHSSFNESTRNISSTSWAYANRLTPSSHLNQSLTGAGGQSPQNTSWDSSFYNSSLNMSGAISSPSTSFNSPFKKYLKDEIITDEKGLQKYLKEISKNERSAGSETHSTHTTYNAQPINSFWNYYSTAANLLKTSLYQLSPSSAIAPMKQGGKSEGDFEGAPEVLKQISPAKLSQYVANLRMWISITILQRLESEINNIDDSFRSRGFSDLQIGSVGLERLKKTAENQQFVSLHVPMLPLIVPFLEMSTNQEYLVQRIKDLSKGSCIADYRWDSGSSYHGLNWDEHLPTDSAILFHLFCTYLDNQLMPLPQPGGRPFFTRYVVIGDKKSAKDTLAEVDTKNKTKSAILCKNQLKPKFNFISDQKIHNCPYDRNNLFYVIIQFLFYMKNHHGGLLEGVNLGKSGINILCVIED